MIYISYSFQFLSFAAGMVSLFVALQLFRQYKFSYLKSNISMMVGYILIMLINSIGSIVEFSQPEMTQSFNLYNKILFFILPLILMYQAYHFDLLFSGLMKKSSSRKIRNTILVIVTAFLLFHAMFLILHNSLPFFLPAIIMMLMQIVFFIFIFRTLFDLRKTILHNNDNGKIWLNRIYVSELLYFILLIVIIGINLTGLFKHDFFMSVTSFMSMVINPLLMYFFVKYHDDRFAESETIESDLFQQYEITDREQEIIALVCEGKTNKEIAEVLFLSPLTVRDHLSNIYRKTNVSNRMKLANIFKK